MALDVALDHGYADVDGVRLHYARRGLDDAPLIVFVHGFPEFWYAWKEQLAHFGGDFLAVAYDQRGFNLSAKPEGVEAYRPAALTADLAGLIRHFGRDKAVVVGHDWGGVTAWAFAMRHPEMTERLAIVNAPHPAVFGRLLAEDADQQAASAYMTEWRKPGAAAKLLENDCARLRRVVTDPLKEAGVFDDDDERAYVANWQVAGALDASLNYYRAMALKPPAEGGAPPAVNADHVTVRVPALVIWGMKDSALLPQNLDGLDAYVPDLTVHRIATGTHWVVHEFPDEVNAAIRGFVA